jgi:hypothetical protein
MAWGQHDPRSALTAEQLTEMARLADAGELIAVPPSPSTKAKEQSSMSRKDPNPMTGDLNDPDRLTRAVAQADRLAATIGYPAAQQIDDQYRQRTYQALIARGEPPAQAQANAEFWARLKASSPEHVHGPGETVDEILGRVPTPASITEDPITGAKTYNPGYQPYAAATSGGPSGSPPTILEYSRSRWLGMAQPINRFSANPGGEYYAWVTGTAPTMFGAGDLPVITGSGVDPSILRWVAWPIRHTAAFTESRATVAQLIELSLEGDPEGWHDYVSPDGRAALDNYFGRIATWVTSLPIDGDGIPAQLSLEDLKREMQRFYPDESGGGTAG